ncbi:Calnexin [Gracilaria domingensis]|nr:Calnexin [Gracilaria domingensis]
MIRLSLLPLLCLVLLLVLHPSQTARSDAIVLGTADDDIADDLIDEGMDEDDMDIGVEDDEEEPEDDDDIESAPEPDKPAVIDPEGEENASGYQVPDAGSPLFFDAFQDSSLPKWTYSSIPQYSGRFAVGQGAKPTFKGDRAMIIPQKARHYGISAEFSGLEDPSSTDFVVQYEVKLDQGMTCGGAYIKMPTTGFKSALFDGSTQYSVMFGPDKCGATDKVHFIFQSKNPVTGKMVEHHLESPPSVANTYDRKTHLYTLSVTKDGSFKVLIDGDVKKEGTLSDSFDPPVQPPKEIDDPEDKKPGDWVDKAKIPDPDATKPDDWDEDAPKEIVDEDAVKPEGWLDDEPEEIPDPEAKMPEGYDEEEDGEWKAPLIANPKCEEVGCGEWTKPTKKNPDFKGKWRAPLIDNPKYIGPWKPRKIPNEEYYDIPNPSLLPINAVGFEIWTMDQGVLFDNMWIGTSLDEATSFAELTFKAKQKKEIEIEEEETKELTKENPSRTGKFGPFLDKMEDVLDTLERALQPVEAYLAQAGLEPYLDKLIDLGIQKPMTVVVSAPLLIVVVLLILLTGGKKKETSPPSESETTTDVGAKKKTDEPTPDDVVEDVSTTTTTKEEPEGTIRKRRTAKAE